jgi:membrane-bound serine protease (ClpP class)
LTFKRGGGEVKKIYAFLLMIVVLIPFAHVIGPQSVQADGETVYVIPIENEVEKGLEAFLTRAINEAREQEADHIIFEVNTPGGLVEAANDIGELLQSVEIDTTTYIRSRALSAGSYIALFSDYIYMAPQATIGASGIINNDGTAAEQKAQSYWREAMGSAAEAGGRERIYAEAMADASIDLPEYNAPEGTYLTLGPTKALEVGYSDGTVDSRADVLAALGLENADIVEVEQQPAETLARFLTNSVVVSILLSLAGIGLVVELYSPGFGVAGSIGLISLVLFFYGHLIAGLAGYEVFVLLIIGAALIVVEFFVPGGILGGLGTMSIIVSLFMATDNIFALSLSLLIAITLTILVAVYLYKRIGLQKGLLRHIILADRETVDKGYVSSVSRKQLVGLKGRALTPLRPSGTGLFEGERLDIVSVGNFIKQNDPIEIISVNGSRIVVQRIEEEEK